MRVCVNKGGTVVIDCSEDELARLRAMSRKHALATIGDEADGLTPQGGGNLLHGGPSAALRLRRRVTDELVSQIRIDPKRDEAGYLKQLERVVEACGRHICDSPKVAYEKYIAPQVLFKNAPWLLSKRWAMANAMNMLLPETALWYTVAMKTTDGLANEADGTDRPRLIREESADEGWTATPIGHRPGDPVPDDFDPFGDEEWDDDEDDDDPSFYTEEDYREMPVLRKFLMDLGGDDPLAGEETDGGDGR